ncbi:WYL domain-containing protein [Fulvivirga sp. 29W222]|uniref:WYL domain-containing protein n=1 Tax=Fulvivirga marina TaxID=2494733 RepID=A0A937G0N7_9BACT|nr:WYL domain-containing protein [Fulvivirga marina]MBL6448477.1 WYL domain-containing protein [Fulvivirga marina]
MPVNRNALVRYKTIDNCLRNRYRLWTLEDLIDACSEALYEYEGIDKGVSRRTVQMDIQMMRSDKLGYHAPIIVKDKKYYTYEDPDYSITNIPLTDQDLGKLTEVVDILKQFKGFTHFQELSGMVQKLEDKIHVSKTKERPIIDIEKNENLKGLEYIDPLYQAISSKKCIELTYQSFKARSSNTFIFHPALLKEFRNRWFVLGKKKSKDTFLLLALDRIEEINDSDKSCMPFDEASIINFFKDVVGVSVNSGEEPQEVMLLIEHSNAPYVLTKPIHHSQQMVEKNGQGVVISLQVQHNFELEREILGFGDYIKVISPSRLRSRIKERLAHASDLYNTELNKSRVKHFGRKLEARGTVMTNHVYTRKELSKMGSLLHHYKSINELENGKVYAIRNLLNKIPELKVFLLNRNLKTILSNIDENLFLTKALFFNKPPQSNWYVTWHQDKTINVVEKTEVDGFSGWTKKEDHYGVVPPEEILLNTVTVRVHLDDATEENGALKVLAGSHNKILNDHEIELVTGNSIASTVEVMSGGIHIMKPLLLHASSKTTNNRNRRVIHLEFNSKELPGGLEWAEKSVVVHPD